MLKYVVAVMDLDLFRMTVTGKCAQKRSIIRVSSATIWKKYYFFVYSKLFTVNNLYLYHENPR